MTFTAEEQAFIDEARHHGAATGDKDIEVKIAESIAEHRRVLAAQEVDEELCRGLCELYPMSEHAAMQWIALARIRFDGDFSEAVAERGSMLSAVVAFLHRRQGTAPVTVPTIIE